MAYIPQILLFIQAGTYTYTVTDALSGMVLLTASGPTAMVSVSTDGSTFTEVSSVPSAPLAAGHKLRVVVAQSGVLTELAYGQPVSGLLTPSASPLVQDGAQLYTGGGGVALQVRVGGVTYTLPLNLQHPAALTVNQGSDPGGLYKTHTLPGGFDPAQDTLTDLGGSGVLMHNAAATQDSDLGEGEYRLVGSTAHYRPVLPTSWDATSFQTVPGVNPTFDENAFYLDPAPANIVSGTTSLRLRDADGNTQELVDQIAVGGANPFAWSVSNNQLYVTIPDDGTNRDALSPPWQTVEIF